MKYAIYPPKMTSNFQLYYKDLTILIIDEDKIIGAKKYSYDGSSRVISYLDESFNPVLSTHFDSIKDIETARLNNNNRTYWTFNTEREAFIQKLWMLKKLREQFLFHQKENKEIFDSKIPDLINHSFDIAKSRNPEYFL